MKQEDLVTIIIPCYKTEYEKIKKCITSIVTQSYRDLEILVIDDASGNEFAVELEELTKSDSRIQIICLDENIGAPAARNKAIEHAKGDYLLFIDSDDSINKFAVEIMMEDIKKFNSDIVIGDFVVTVDNAQEQKEKRYDNNPEIMDRDTALAYLLTNHGFGSTVCCRLAKKKLWGSNPFITNVIHEDIASMWRVIARCKTICHEKNPLYYYFQGSSSSIHKSTVEPRFCYDYFRALDIRNAGINKITNKLAKENSCAYLIHCPSIYVYGRKIKDKKSRNEIINKAKEVFKNNWTSACDCNLLNKRQKTHIFLFRHWPYAYYIFYCLMRKMKGRRS